MQVIEFVAAYGGWAWIVGGMVLLALELVVPGGFLLWLGVAGIVTGLAALFQPISWPVQWVIFGFLSLVSVYVWQRYVRSRPEITDRPLLNHRAERFVGQEAVLAEPIRQGFGHINLDDTVWRVKGPDLSAGARVRIVGHDGALLRVEPISD